MKQRKRRRWWRKRREEEEGKRGGGQWCSQVKITTEARYMYRHMQNNFNIHQLLRLEPIKLPKVAIEHATSYGDNGNM